MHIALRRECPLCTAMKSAFCSSLPEEYRDVCITLTDEIQRGSEEAYTKFIELGRKIDPEILKRAVEEFGKFLKAGSSE